MSARHRRSRSTSDNNEDSTNREISFMQAGKPVREEAQKLLHPKDTFKTRCTASSDRRAALEEDVEQLQMRLQYERTMRHALERAMGQASSSLSPGHRHYDAQIRELMMEITSLEEQVLDRERHVLSLYRNVFDQCITGLQSLQNSNQASPTHVQNEYIRHPCTVSSALYMPSKCPVSQHRRHVSTSNQCSQRASMHLLSKSRHTALFSGRFSIDDQIQNLQPQTGSKVEQGCEFSLTNQKNAIPFTLKDYINESPNRLSEELVRCMAAIYCKLSDPPCVPSGMALSTSSSISSSTTLPSYDVLSDGWSPGWKAQSVCDTPLKNPFKLKGEAVNAGPYRFMVEIPWICADNDQLAYATCMLRLFRSMVEHLEKVDPSQMQRDSKLAFWINVYNALVMHAYLAYGIPRNNLRRMPLFQRAAYKIGGYSVSANTIEHSILCCRTHRPTQWLETLLSTRARFKAGEERRTFGQAFGLDDSEPLVFFALCSGGYSDPAVRVYTAKNVHDELETAKREFLQASIGIHNDRKVFLPKILERYAKEASISPTNLLIWVSQNVDKQQQAAINKCIEGKPHKKSAQCIEWLQYDANFRYIFARDLVARTA